jgi:hypothetical protein
MTASTSSQTSQTILRQTIPGSRRLSNYFWATVILMGGLGFFLASLSSYFQVNLVLFTDATQLFFKPQGLVMGLYGIAALALSTFLWLSIKWDVGGGYNEFNQETRKVTVFRWGFPGKNRQITLSYDFDDIQAIRIEVREGLNPKRVLYLKIRGKGQIPLTRVGQPLPLSELENQGAQFARFLGVPLEGL